MIYDNFVIAAIKIRRTYLKLTNNMDFYKKQAQKLTENLENIIEKISNLKTDLNGKSNKMATDHAMQEMSKIIKELENEGQSLEKVINPINNSIEKLSLEEAELWRNIKEKHYNIPDDDIIEYIKARLISENLN